MQQFDFSANMSSKNVAYLNCNFLIPIAYALYPNDLFHHVNIVTDMIKSKLCVLSNIKNAIMVLKDQND